jgi:sialic acid synthase SpsE
MTEKYRTNLCINNKIISADSPTFFIADIAANHDGSLKRARELIFRASESGADAAKFQHFSARTIVSDTVFRSLGGGKSHQAGWSKSVFEVYQDASLDLDWTESLREACNDAGIIFFTSPYDLDLVDYIDSYVPAFKIGSGDITWLDIVRAIASKNKPYFLATGASELQEVVAAVDIATKINNQICLMQCNTNYTGDLSNFKYINLRVLCTYARLFPGILLGLSDHTPGYSTVLGAITLGATVIEKHFTDDQTRAGPDHRFSMNPESWGAMVLAARQLENALGGESKRVEANERDTVVLQRRAVCASKNLASGQAIRVGDLVALRPCPSDAISANSVNDIGGRVLKKHVKAGEYIKWDDLS